MLKFIKTIFVATALVSSAFAASQISQQEIKEMDSLELFKGAGVKVKHGYDAGSLYLLNVDVRGKADRIFLTKDKKFLIAGDVISTKDGKPLEVPVDLSSTKNKEAFTFGTGKDEYVLFTDPECPYCKKFESYLPQVEDKVKIRVFYFPLDFHKNAKDISVYVMSQKSYKDKVNAMINTTKDTPAFKNRNIPADELKALTAKVEEQMSIGSKLGVRGTPSVFDKEGNKVSWAAMLQKYGIVVK